MKRNKFIEPLIFHGVPLGGRITPQQYLFKRVMDYRDSHEEFDRYSLELEMLLSMIDAPELEQMKCFFKYKSHTNLIFKYFNFFRKQFNYSFSAEETVEYIIKCIGQVRDFYNHDYKLGSICKTPIVSKYDRKFSSELSLDVRPKDKINEFWFVVSFEGNSPSSGSKVRIVTDSFLIRDAYELFGTQYELIGINRVIGDNVESFIYKNTLDALIEKKFIRFKNRKSRFKEEYQVFELLK